MKEFDALVAARKVLDNLWKASFLRGRCWGPRRPDNPFRASNITFTSGSDDKGQVELVSVNELPDGTLRIHEFVATKGTALGEYVRRHLEAAKLRVETNRKGE